MLSDKIRELMMSLGVEIYRESIDSYPVEYLGQVLEIFHGEFERRNPELGRWTLVKDEA